MEFKPKTIGVLTSGGDAPGMNAAIRAVVRAGCENGFRVMGIRRGYNGLMQGDMFEMNLRSVSDIISRGGTILQTARSKEFATDEGVKRAARMAGVFQLDAIVVIGGDGSFRGARDLSLRGIPCVAIPGTIDNDITATDYTIGFDTAMNTVIELVDKLRDTCESHARCDVVEVMGNGSGYLYQGALTDGDYVLTYVGEYWAGIFSKKTYTFTYNFTVDTTAPSVSLKAGGSTISSGSYTNKAITFTASATRNAGSSS